MSLNDLPRRLASPTYEPIFGDQVDTYLDEGSPTRRSKAIAKANAAAAKATEAHEDDDKYGPVISVPEWKRLLGDSFDLWLTPVRAGKPAGLLFDRAASLWYLSLLLEAVSVISSAAGGLAPAASVGGIVMPVIALALLLGGYVLRLTAEERQDVAQSMRRQAALSDALGWPIEPTIAEEWRRRAGARLLRKAAANPRGADYYSTDTDLGPRALRR